MERLDLNVGTKSILFGVHQFIFHPLTVGCAWKALYGVWPKWHEWIAVFFHDVGYWRSPNMDGPEGRRHPIRGAEFAGKVVLNLHWLWVNFRYPIRSHVDEPFKLDKWCEGFELAAATSQLSLGHSRFFAKQAGLPVSKLFAADKASIYFDPKWAYLLRAYLSSEIHEYVANSKLPPGTTASQWHSWYQRKVGEII